ncbi:MAG: homocysteine biosynthesis protein [Armatimonadia bacterium]
MAKTVAEINEKIKNGQAVVVTAEDMIGIVAEQGAKKAAKTVDVVTTGTFGPMCSSGAFLNFGHTKPRMRMSKVWLNDVPAYAGIAAVDCYIGATEVVEGDPLNRNHPGEFRYGGAHVIADLVAGRDVLLRAESYGTDCYPRRELETLLRLKDLNQAFICNPRNAYQNYNVAVNLSKDRDLYTYMGVLKKSLGSAGYCSAGQLSPLLNDPYFRTIGIGSRIFIGGAQGYIFWQGTQHDPASARSENGVPKGGAGTIATVGDLKAMNPRYVVGVSMYGYGVSLALGIGIPIPILDADMARYTAVSDAEILAPVVDYSRGYAYGERGPLGHISYAELKSGSIEVEGKTIPTNPLSSYPRAREIALELKSQIDTGQFLLTEPVETLPSADSDVKFKLLNERPLKSVKEVG